ncbi:hypothetical protein NDU88_001690 [Pleurodeles waltl]|uniref:Uncharacterized protein n=1 Tax=Pleurodeles waltl TaxID=8319 RepID=A0AAV7TKD9_PLEWA|nr:hypothetical protein NDU88_001690 [Pleurodeles waltl]
MDNNSRVLQALNMLQEECREDLLLEGVLEQSWVSLKRPKRALSEGVAAAGLACALLQHKSKKFEQKSSRGRKVSTSLECKVVDMIQHDTGLSVTVTVARRGGVRFTQRSGASLHQRVPGTGRGMAFHGAVAAQGHLGAGDIYAHAFCKQRVTRGRAKQALLHSESNLERGEAQLEARTSKMAPPTDFNWNAIIIVPDDGEEGKIVARVPISKIQLSEQPFMVQEGRML